MEDVIWLEPTEGGVLLRTLFEEPQEVKARIKSIDLLDHRVLLTTTPRERGGQG
jgi:predicted RNA-binding protein